MSNSEIKSSLLGGGPTFFPLPALYTPCALQTSFCLIIQSIFLQKLQGSLPTCFTGVSIKIKRNQYFSNAPTAPNLTSFNPFLQSEEGGGRYLSPHLGKSMNQVMKNNIRNIFHLKFIKLFYRILLILYYIILLLIYLNIHLSIYLPAYLSTYLPTLKYNYLTYNLPTYLPTLQYNYLLSNLPTYLPTLKYNYLTSNLPTNLPTYPPIKLPYIQPTYPPIQLPYIQSFMNNLGNLHNNIYFCTCPILPACLFTCSYN